MKKGLLKAAFMSPKPKKLAGGIVEMVWLVPVYNEVSGLIYVVNVFYRKLISGEDWYAAWRVKPELWTSKKRNEMRRRAIDIFKKAGRK